MKSSIKCRKMTPAVETAEGGRASTFQGQVLVLRVCRRETLMKQMAEQSWVITKIT